MQRFFVPDSHIADGRITLPADASRQLAQVLRARPGDTVTALDDSGYEYAVTLDTVSRRRTTGVITGRRLGDGEPQTAITLYQGLMKSDRFEYVLQKGTELGIARFVPFISERTVTRSVITPNRLTRWRRIVREAAEQAGRCRLPAIADALTFTEVCDSIAKSGARPAIIGWECERERGIRQTLLRRKADIRRAQSISIVIGSEGGLTDAEAAHALDCGMERVSMGRRILRAETAGIIAAAAVLYEMDEMA